ncbi:MAG: STAS domain-containing protein [Thermoplasmata archaeon]|nr:STAS domain-containing protein [Thermoplasmata archaeon]
MVEIEQVIVSSSDGIEKITGVGELNLYIVEPFERALSNAVTSGNDIVVDYRQASFIDTAFVAALVPPALAMLERGRRLKVLVTEGEYPQYVLKTVCFGDLMDIVAEEGSTMAKEVK